jgi:glycosyltransferase involved in cell wall biosynthesis
MKVDTRSVPATNLLGFLIKLQAPVSISLEQELFARCDKIAAVATSVAEELEEYGVNPSQVPILGNGVDTEIFFPGESSHSQREPYLLTAGRLGPRKGLEDLIRCAKIVTEQCPEVQFLIAGSGPLAAALRHEIEQHGLTERVHLLGHIDDRGQMVDLYRGALAYIHPAHYEGLPTVLLEAMACGRPAIATAVSGALDVIRDGSNGLLVPPRAPEVMAAAILRLLHDRALRERIGGAGLETIGNRYTWQAIGHDYTTLYRNLIAGTQA